ncbi:MAG: acyltransferase [Pedobacter sp.]|nr:MAG: acyltransferase [Pedobacter sp.]
MSQRNAGVDFFRLLGACAVIFVHSIYANKVPMLVSLGRWAVPFFFMVSGYFFQKNFSKYSLYAFTKTIKSLLAILVSTNLFYLLFLFLTKGSLTGLANHFTLVVGTYFHLWFLTSLLLGYLVLWVFLRTNRQAILPYLATLFVFFILALNPYSFLVGDKAHPLYARLLLSIPFLWLGFFVAKHTLQRYVSKPICWLLVSVGIGLQIVELWFLLGNRHDLLLVNFTVGTIPLSLGLFLLSLRTTVSPTNQLSHYGQRYSLQLYLYHPVVNYYLYQALAQQRADGLIYWLSPLLTILLTLSLLVLLDEITPTLFGILSGDFSRFDLVKSKSFLSDRLKTAIRLK